MQAGVRRFDHVGGSGAVNAESRQPAQHQTHFAESLALVPGLTCEITCISYRLESLPSALDDTAAFSAGERRQQRHQAIGNLIQSNISPLLAPAANTGGHEHLPGLDFDRPLVDLLACRNHPLLPRDHCSHAAQITLLACSFRSPASGLFSSIYRRLSGIAFQSVGQT